MKKTQRYIIGVLFFAVTVAISCTKEKIINDGLVFGGVKINLALLPNSPAIDIFMNGRKIGALKPIANLSDPFLVPVVQGGKLEIYKSGTKELIAERTVNVEQDKTVDYTVGYSEDLGIKGWIERTHVSKDSVSFQVLNSISLSLFPNALSPELEICTIDYTTMETSVLYTVKKFEHGKLIPQKFTLPMHDADGNLIRYCGKLKDPATGQYIINPSLQMDLFVFGSDESDAGLFRIYSVENDTNTPTNIRINPIEL